jgi:FkbM family methyltransferase
MKGLIMERFLLKVLRKVVQLVAKTNSKLPHLIELDLQHMQGKGSGGDSTEVEAREALKFMLRTSDTHPIVLDVGANIGLYSEAVRRIVPQATIFAFEPSSNARKKLEEKFIGDSSVTIVPLALGNSNSSQTLWADSPGSGLASLTKRRLDHFGIKFNQAEKVDVVTLDSWADSKNVVPTLIKMDVEGHELDILKGGLKTVAATKVIQFEFGGCNIDTRTFFQDFWYLLTDLGFSIYRISQTGPIKLNQYSESDECFRTTNYLAVRE